MDLAFKLLRLKVKDSRSISINVNYPTFKLVFDKERDYNQNSNDVGELLPTQCQTKNADLPVDQLCKQNIECIVGKELREFNSFRQSNSEEVIKEHANKMKVTLDSSRCNLNMLEHIFTRH